ncbi:glycyl-radical enzyme activating protein [Anaerocolumna sp. AGMB13025]|uniref:glycyl-radical enzyme activating protein n=1 Tax=Anaerocolumna sp. AGMB13025 TaxID=3039116 RepID=UPI00241D536A|nr:glycyl-radical enzyme activating protein [Anaerocolumna sp. AGMB13025]WFR59770.1 glycyl-radical enzyme activating protein [Anaerocolumna sp. AGMB13025]
MGKPLITDIQKYSIHDGSGIRTTIFFKGCPLCCIWCHNPETQKFSPQLLFNQETCTGCGSCINACPKAAITLKWGIAATKLSECNGCGSCVEYCLQNIRTLAGEYYTVDELIREIEKDKVFYEQSKGGVTLSGGEVLAQDTAYIMELLTKLYRKGYRVNIDTSGYAPFSVLKDMVPMVDTFLYDIKILDTALHKKYTGVGSERILENLKRLSQEKASIWIRIPVIEGVNATTEQMEQIAIFLKENHISFSQINLLPYHDTGSSKYKRLQLMYPGEDLMTPSNQTMETIKIVFEQYGFSNIKIGG